MLSFLFILRITALASGMLLGASVFVGDNKIYRNRVAIDLYHLRNLVPPWRGIAVVASFWLIALLVFEPALRSYAQYILWASTKTSRGLLPPYTQISYYFGYVFFHFWLWRILGVLFAGLSWFSTYVFFVKRTNGLLMDRRESFLLTYGVALSGWPNLLVYMVLVLFFYTFFLMAVGLREKFMHAPSAGVRFPISPFLTLALVPTVLYGALILNLIGLGSILRVSLYGV